MEIDAGGTFNASRAAHAALCRAGGSGSSPSSSSPSTPGAAVVNVSATLHYGATWWQAHASAAKAAVDSLTRTLALEWGSSNIRVNGVAPGPVAGTAGLAKLAPGGPEKLAAMLAERVPLGRPARAADIALAVVFLAAPAASGYVNGHTMVVDGGEWMWRPPLVGRAGVEAASRGAEAASRGVGLAGGGARAKM
jgi:peroxisomal 2,4-dienoyl-CoA reductase